MEQLELETAIAASTAKLKVFESHKSPCDAMNEYVTSRLPSTDLCSHTQGANMSSTCPVREVHIPAARDEEDDQDHIPDTTTRNMEQAPHAHLRHPPTSRASPTKPQEPMTTGDRVYELMKHQNIITEMLVKQQDLSLLAKRDIPVFFGDPLTCRSFLRAFFSLSMLLTARHRTLETNFSFWNSILVESHKIW